MKKLKNDKEYIDLITEIRTKTNEYITKNISNEFRYDREDVYATVTMYLYLKIQEQEEKIKKLEKYVNMLIGNED